MTTERNERLEKAFGQTVAAVPAIKDMMVEVQRALAQGVPADSIRSDLRASLASKGLSPLALAWPSLCTAEFRAIPWSLGLLGLAQEIAAMWEFDTIGEALDHFEHATGIADWLANFILAWAESGEPGSIFPASTGSVFETQMVDESGDPMPVIISLSAATSDANAIAEEIKSKHYELFGPPKRFHQPEESARRLRLFMEGRSDRQIAREELDEEGFTFRARDDAEFKEELRLRTNEVKQARHRWKKYVTEMVK